MRSRSRTRLGRKALLLIAAVVGATLPTSPSLADTITAQITVGRFSPTGGVTTSGAGQVEGGLWVYSNGGSDGGIQTSFGSLAGAAANGDSTPPVATPSATGTLGTNQWYTSDVTVDWNWTDNAGGSGIDAANCTTSSTSTGDGNPITLSATCKDLSGNTGTASYGVKVDKTKPTLSPVVSPNPVLLNGSATVSAGAADVPSGLASSSCGVLVTSSVGAKSVTCSATDNAGNSNSATASYTVLTVIYNWSGFFQPVDNLPTLNSVKAGSAIPVKFSLAGNQGLSIFAAGYPVSAVTSCGSTPTDSIETTATAGSSSLSYDATTDQYNYVWKTEKAWANTCRTLNVKFIDGTTHQANFKFTK